MNLYETKLIFDHHVSFSAKHYQVGFNAISHQSIWMTFWSYTQQCSLIQCGSSLSNATLAHQ
jgi:hypothetical protein